MLRRTLGRYEVKDSDTVMESSQRIARNSLELAYSWDIDMFGKAEIVDGGNIVG